MRHGLLTTLLCLTLAACGGDKGTPTSPSPNPSQQTRTIQIDGDLNYGDIRVGDNVQKTLRVYNLGNSPMTVTGLTVPSGTGSNFTVNWTSGTIAANSGFQDIHVRFTPTEHRSYSGTFTVEANHTNGSNTKPITARGIRDPFTRSGSGNTVFDIPTGITRVRITGSYDVFCENFIMRVGGRTVVNEILGSCSSANGRRTYEGTHVVSGTVVEVTGSNGVNWTFTEIHQ